MLLLLLLAAVPCFAEFRAGLKAGVPLTTYFDTGRNAATEYSAATRRYTLGPSVEWQWTEHIGFAGDALYKRMGYVAILTGASSRFAIDVKGNSWDFPLRVKYSSGRRWQPYVDAGPSLRYIGPVRGRGESRLNDVITPVDTASPSELRKRLFAGLTTAAGLESRRKHSPWLIEIRYTRWISNLRNVSPELRLTATQVEFVAGWLFARP
jgi:hypothetical protein